MIQGSNSRLPLRRLFLTCLALLALLFITAEASLPHNHDDTCSAACSVCHMAQQAPAQTTVAAKLPEPVAVAWRAPREIQPLEIEQLPQDNSSRAPPSSWL